VTTKFEHVAKFSLSAAPARVFRALTEPSELERWFARHARVELRLGGDYRFWGSATLGTPTESEARQTITTLERDRRLGFSWPLLGADTEVTFALVARAEADGCELHIRHSVHAALPLHRPEHAIDDLWRMHAGNLSDLLLERTSIYLPDFETGAAEVRSEIEIAAPPAKVWRALLVPELMNQWLGGQAEVDLNRRAYSYGWKYDVEGKGVSGGPTKIIELVEHRKLVTDWPDWRGDPDKPSTRITWLLEPLADGKHTRLTLIHAGFEHPVDRSDYQQGWSEFLRALSKAVVES
jgi:uncharacterized protein YndB with AHSA1/START domain